LPGRSLATGDAGFHAMQADSIATWLILIGFLINAGAPPLAAWLPDAYPEASWSGTVFLSAFTTKTAVYVLLRGFPGTEILIWVGVFMIFYGIVYALLENDMRRILAYSIVNQVGFMVVGIGIGTEMALNGAAAHAFSHIIYKALLLMSAGAVLAATGRRKCSELGGLFHSMPLTTICGTIGALAISSFPLTSGFVSKSMVTQAAIDGHLQTVWLFLAAASAGVFLHAGIKFPWFVFFQKDSGLRPPDPPASMKTAMILFAFLCIALGIWPAAAVCAAALRGQLRALHSGARDHAVAVAAVLRPGLLRHARLPEADADHNARCRLALAPRRTRHRTGLPRSAGEYAGRAVAGHCRARQCHRNADAARKSAGRPAAAFLAHRQHVTVGRGHAAGLPRALLPRIAPWPDSRPRPRCSIPCATACWPSPCRAWTSFLRASANGRWSRRARSSSMPPNASASSPVWC
jgi:hypothetical protein